MGEEPKPLPINIDVSAPDKRAATLPTEGDVQTDMYPAETPEVVDTEYPDGSDYEDVPLPEEVVLTDILPNTDRDKEWRDLGYQEARGLADLFMPFAPEGGNVRVFVYIGEKDSEVGVDIYKNDGTLFRSEAFYGKRGEPGREYYIALKIAHGLIAETLPDLIEIDKKANALDSSHPRNNDTHESSN